MGSMKFIQKVVKKTFFTGVHGEGVIKCALQGQKNAFFSTFWINFMECHSIQFTTISINVERGIVMILFKYRYFQDLLIDIDIDIDISQILLIDIDIDIDIFQNHHIDIDIDIDFFGIALSISISISIFFRIALSISISIFFKSVDISTIDMSYRYIEQGYPYLIFVN